MKTLAAAAVWALLGALAYGVLAPHRFGLLAGGTAVLVLWIWINERRIKNHSPRVMPEAVYEEEPQVTGVTVTRVGESCTIVSHPSERRSYRVERRGTPDS